MCLNLTVTYRVGLSRNLFVLSLAKHIAPIFVIYVAPLGVTRELSPDAFRPGFSQAIVLAGGDTDSNATIAGAGLVLT